MSNGKGFARLAAALAVAILPISAQQQGADRSCWLRDVASPSDSSVYALCEQGTLWVTTDGGQKWSSRILGSNVTLRAMAFLDQNRGLAVGDGGTILATEDAGKTWTARKSGTAEKLLDVAFVGNSGWATGYNGVMAHSGDGGKTWAAQATGTTQTLEAIFFLDEQRGWATGWAGTILRTSDGGAHWEQIKTNAASWSLSSIYFKDTNNGWIVGFAGQILRSTDGGSTWKPQTSPVKGWLTSIAFDTRGRGWITHDDGFLRSDDGGETWKLINTDGRYFLSRLVRVKDTVWALGQSALLRETQDGGKWTRIESLVLDRSMVYTEPQAGTVR